VITPKKIEEWIKEVEERPTSASIILQYISNRLRDLTARNEELLAENIALVSGKRVEEYEQRIAHLEYQLELLKRQLGGDLSPEAIRMIDQATAEANKQDTLSLLIYCQQGRLVRFEIHPHSLEDGSSLGQIQGEVLQGEEPPRLLIVPSTEEVMSIYTSGRITTYPVTRISTAFPSLDGKAGIIHWDQAILPDEPRGGERLACLMPVSKLPLSEFFVQTSRRGFVKKIRTSMAQSILANRYIGSGVKLPLDRTFSICLGGKEDQLILVSHEGYLLRLEMNRISSSVEEAIRLGSSDHLVSSFLYHPGSSVLVMTQMGKGIQITEDRLEVAASLKTKGQAAFSTQRREQGARVAGAGSVREEDWAAGLHRDGQIILYSLRKIFASGRIPEGSQLLCFEPFPAPAGYVKTTKDLE
jgi:DNA gyrase/topoisomerase IV subunit A